MQTTLEREVPDEARPQVHKMAVINRWLVAAVVVLLLAVVGLGAYAISRATSDEAADVPEEPAGILVSGYDELSARQEDMVDAVEEWMALAGRDKRTLPNLAALMTPDATMRGAFETTVRVDDGTFASSMAELFYSQDPAFGSLFVLRGPVVVVDDAVIVRCRLDSVGDPVTDDLKADALSIIVLTFRFTRAGEPLISSIMWSGEPNWWPQY